MIIRLTEATLENAGAKAAVLGRLARAGFPVPPGFVIPVDAYRAVTAGLNLTEAASSAPDEVRRLVAAQPVPPWLLAELAEALTDLGDHPVAVRSSATTEDTPTASAAGQHDTFLGVDALPEAVAAKIQAIWGSLWSLRAVAYRQSNPTAHPSPADPGIAVIVQRHVDAQVAGVLFTSASRTPDDTAVAEGTAVLDDTAMLGGAALVESTAAPDGSAVLDETAVLGGSAVLDETAVLGGSAVLDETAVLGGAALVEGTAAPDGSAVLDETAVLGDTASLDTAVVEGTAVLDDTAVLAGGGLVEGTAVLEASWGLGESVVQGLVNPDTYTLTTTSGRRLLTRRLGTKLVRTDRNISAGLADGSGIVASEVAAVQQREFCLSECQVERLMELGQEVADYLGGQQDIEFAVEGDHVWLLQARPVTVPLLPHETAASAVGVLRGVGGGAGVASGPARLVDSVADFARVQPGDILVCRFTDPAWTPLFGVVAGVITEVGGRLSHAAIVARERRIPAVLGVPDVMTTLADGQPITIEGSTGVVTPGPVGRRG
ncbi:PEP/pyruvate-binding domain-containing protein [Kribbella sp. NPDC023855]|uniref:PEP/pyruvate-binding domain-containing protein n=1 Tax=Kribbella sp. NPDC023855 TaxID=3154698 RepID=UPI0033E8720A